MAAEGTRHQAELQGMNEHDMVSLDAPNGRIAEALQREDARRDFNQMSDCYPIFCLTGNIPKAVSDHRFVSIVHQATTGKERADSPLPHSTGPKS